MIKVLGGQNTLLDHYIAEVRDVEVQKDSLRFRHNMRRMGEIFAYEISKTLEYTDKEVITSLGEAQVPVLVEYPVLITILRTGLPIQQGLLSYFDKSQNGFISAYRKYEKGDFEIQIEYVSCPDISGKTIIVSDAMLATGESVVKALRELLNTGKPKHIHVVSILAGEEGVEKLKKTFAREKITLWVGAIDSELTAQAYLVPGLGDAGDLAFGEKD